MSICCITNMCHLLLEKVPLSYLSLTAHTVFRTFGLKLKHIRYKVVPQQSLQRMISHPMFWREKGKNEKAVDPHNEIKSNWYEQITQIP